MSREKCPNERRIDKWFVLSRLLGEAALQEAIKDLPLESNSFLDQLHSPSRVNLLQLPLSFLVLLVLLHQFLVKLIHLPSQELLPVFFHVDPVEHTHVFLLETAQRDLLRHLLVACLDPLNNFAVRLVELLEEGALEILLALDQEGDTREEPPVAGHVVLVATAGAVAAEKGGFLAVDVHADVVDCETAGALELGLDDRFED